MPKQGRCPPPGAPFARSLPICGQQGRLRLQAAGKSHGPPSGGSPAGLHPCVCTPVCLFVCLFLARLSARPHCHRCRRGGAGGARYCPAGDPRSMRGLGGGAGIAFHTAPCPGRRTCPGVAPNRACWRHEGVIRALTSAGLNTCATLCRSCGRQRWALSASRLRLTGDWMRSEFGEAVYP